MPDDKDSSTTDVDELQMAYSTLGMVISNLGVLAAADEEPDPEIGAAVSRIGSAMRHLANSLDIRNLEVEDDPMDRDFRRIAKEDDERLAHAASKRLYEALKSAHVLSPAETVAVMEGVLSDALHERRERGNGEANA